MSAERLTTKQLNRATLARQLLLERAKLSPVEVIERLCGMQAQEPKPPFIGLWTRIEDFRSEDLTRALEQRLVVRATAMRATLHLMSAKDFTELRMSLQPALSQAMKVLGARADGLDLERLLPVADGLLSEGPRDFNQLRESLSEAFPAVDERALGYAVRTNLPLVMVPTEDRWSFPRNSEFALAESWLGSPLHASQEPQRLLVRYLAAFGPASVTDMQTWSGLKGLKGTFDGMRERLLSFTDEPGRELFDLPDAPRPEIDVPARTCLLPEFDNLVLAHDDRSRVLAAEHRPLIVTKNLRVKAAFLWDGFVHGTWAIKRTKSTAILNFSPFAKLPKRAVDELLAEGEKLIGFAEPEASKVEVILEAPVV